MEWFTKQTFGELLDSAVERFGQRTAVTFEGCHLSFDGLRSAAQQVARGLVSVGVTRGDIVALWMDNRPEWLHVEFGAAYIGAILLPVNTSLREKDLGYVLRHSRCSTIVLAAQSGPTAYQSILSDVMGSREEGGLGSLRNVVVLDAKDVPDGWLCWEDFLSRGDGVSETEVLSRTRESSADDSALIMYTSGTTGKPKGVVHSHHAIRNVTDQANRLGVTERDITVMFLPLFHAYGFYEGPLLTLITGARMVLMRRFDPAKTLEAIETERVTMSFGFVTHFSDLLNCPSLGSTDRSSLRVSIMAVGPIAMRPIAYATQARFGGKFVSGFGMTEIGPCASLGFLDEDAYHSCETSGYPLTGYAFKVIDPESGRELDRGSQGEVLVQTYQATEGYLHDSERTAELIDEQGWLHTGDLGVLDSAGYLQILGRYKDQLRVGGENVDPSEVEAFFLEHPSITDALLVGIPDERLGDAPCLCVIARETLSDDSIDELTAFADGKLAAFKRPRYIIQLESFPTTATGKIERHTTKELAIERLNLGTG